MSTIRELVIEGAATLGGVSPSARLDAELLLAHTLGCSRLELITRAPEPVESFFADRFRSLIERRRKREPIAYLTGVQEFYGLAFFVSPAVLIPRPETELLVEESLKFLAGAPGIFRMLDLGTGSGCVAIAIAKSLLTLGRDFDVVAVDASQAAVDTAKENASAHGVASHLKFLITDWFAGLDDSRFQIIVGNPPYIEEGNPEVSPETAFEPASALYAKEQGTSDIQHIIQNAPEFLVPGGTLLLECGYRQGWLASPERVPPQYAQASVLKDLSGKDRVLKFVAG